MSRRRVSAATIYDGVDIEPFAGHVVVEGDRIEAVVRSGPAGTVPAGLDDVPALTACPPASIVCPGFVDIHSHSDLVLLGDPTAPSKLAQGVTTEVVGNCGFSAFPAPGYWLEPLDKYQGIAGYDGVGPYLEALRAGGRASNVATLVGAGSVRASVSGVADGDPPGAAALGVMTDRVVAAAEGGALGLSTGMIYRPGCYAGSEEIVALVRAAAAGGARFFSTHMRDESTGLLASVMESIDIARRADVPLHISHLKAKGRRTWGALRYALDCIAEADHPVTFDFYPYAASMSSVDSLVPASVLGFLDDGQLTGTAREAMVAAIRQQVLAREGDGAWAHVRLAHVPGHGELEGLDVDEAAASTGRSPEALVLDLCVETEGRAEIINHCMDQHEVDSLASLPQSMVASDGYALHVHDGPLVHPRSFGTFPRFLHRYVVEQAALPAGEAIRKMTSRPADVVGLPSVGRLRPGARADLLVVDPAAVGSAATYERPRVLADGIDDIIVGGRTMRITGDGVDRPAGTVLTNRHHPSSKETTP